MRRMGMMMTALATVLLAGGTAVAAAVVAEDTTGGHGVGYKNFTSTITLTGPPRAKQRVVLQAGGKPCCGKSVTITNTGGKARAVANLLIGAHPGDAGKRRKVTFLGVSTSPVAIELAKQLALPEGVGLLVDYLVPNGPAARSGIEQHDVLHKLDDQLLINVDQLRVLVRIRKPNEKAKLTVFRGGKQKTIPVTLGSNQVATVKVRGLLSGSMTITPGAGGGTITDTAISVLRTVPVQLDGKMLMRDGKHSISIQGGKITVIGQDGKVLHEGPVFSQGNDPLIISTAMPPGIGVKVRSMQEVMKQMGMGDGPADKSRAGQQREKIAELLKGADKKTIEKILRLLEEKD